MDRLAKRFKDTLGRNSIKMMENSEIADSAHEIQKIIQEYSTKVNQMINEMEAEASALAEEHLNSIKVMRNLLGDN